MAPQARLLVNDALPCARNRVLDHPKAPKTALARPLGRPNRFARPLLDQPLVWWSGKPNRSPGFWCRWIEKTIGNNFIIS